MLWPEFLPQEHSSEKEGEIEFTSEPSRRLPVYLMLDCSGSMAGAPIEAVNQGIAQLQAQLLDTPSAVETVWIAVITFGTTAKMCIPLTPLLQFEPPDLKPAGTTSLGAAIKLLNESLDRDIVTGSEISKGDWKPLVFLLTDGEPTDHWEDAVALLHKRTNKKIGTLVALGCGEKINQETLLKISPIVIKMEDISGDRLKDFFKWVSQSISGASISADAAGRVNEILPSLPRGLIQI
jgi:uncharacterized protein YegL